MRIDARVKIGVIAVMRLSGLAKIFYWATPIKSVLPTFLQ